MSEKQKKILENFKEVLPQLDDVGKATFLAYGEGMVAQKKLTTEQNSKKSEETNKTKEPA